MTEQSTPKQPEYLLQPLSYTNYGPVGLMLSRLIYLDEAGKPVTSRVVAQIRRTAPILNAQGAESIFPVDDLPALSLLMDTVSKELITVRSFEQNETPKAEHPSSPKDKEINE